MPEEGIVAWYYLSGNRIEIEGLHDKGRTGPERWITGMWPGGVIVTIDIRDRSDVLVAGPKEAVYIAGTEGNWAATWAEGEAPLVLGEQYVAKVRVEGAGAMTRTWLVPVQVEWSGSEDT